MNSQFYNRLMTGLIIAGIGVLFLLDQLNIIKDISIGQIFSTYWPVFIIVFALKGVFFEKRLRYGWIGSYLWNLLALCIGIYFLASNLGYVHFSFGDLIRFMLPVALILFGISMVIRPRSDDHKKKKQEDMQKKMSDIPYAPPPSADDIEWSQSSVLDSKFPIHNDDKAKGSEGKSDTKDNMSWDEPKKEHKRYWKDYKNEQKQHWKEQKEYWKEYGDAWNNYGTGHQKVEYRSGFIGDVYLGQDAWELKPMNISHFIGDTKIDLTRAAIPYGETRLLISAFIGDVTILVPDDIDLQVRVTSSVFIGELNVLDRHESGFARSMVSESSHYKDADKKLRVDVSLFIGDVVVKKVG